MAARITRLKAGSRQEAAYIAKAVRKMARNGDCAYAGNLIDIAVGKGLFSRRLEMALSAVVGRCEVRAMRKPWMWQE